MELLSIGEIADITGGKVKGDGSFNISQIATDSRLVFSNESLLFVALKGERHNGHRYVAELAQKHGIKAFMVSEWHEEWLSLAEVSFVVVSDSLLALQQLGAAYRKDFDSQVLAITGSNGKTVLKEWLFQALSDKKVVRSPKSYNSQVGVPLSLSLLRSGYDLAIIEAGISQPEEMQRLADIIKPDEGIFTCVGQAHQENFESLEQKVREKMLLFKGCQKMYYCSDYELVDVEARKYAANGAIGQLRSWSRKGKQADMMVTLVNQVTAKSAFAVTMGNQSFQLVLPFIDDASIENALQLSFYLLCNGYEAFDVQQRINALAPVAMRLELKKAVQNSTLINDTYNSDIYSLGIALDLLAQQQQHPRKTLIISDIFQTGKSDCTLYAEVAEMVNAHNVDRVIGIGKAIGSQSAFFPTGSLFFPDTTHFLDAMPGLSFRNEAVLLKGSRQFGFERIAAQLEQKTHRTELDVNLNAMVHNLNYYKSLLLPQTKIMVMVKAFSYGSGSYEIARLLEYNKVDYLAVAIADEGVALRQSGITTPIVVMNPEEGSQELMHEYNLEPEVYSFRTLERFAAIARQSSNEIFPVHIKLDTGMHRLGFQEDDIETLIARLLEIPNIAVKSVFTHLAAADEALHDEFTNDQFERFTRMSFRIRQVYPDAFRHVLNSPGIERFPEYQFEMVRLGIGLYGVNVLGEGKVQPISTLRTTISQIKTVYPPDTVGYGRKGKTNGEPKVIGVIPVGYADGLNRKFGNGNTQLLVNGKRVPTIGNVCMDLAMIDLTGVEAKEGDEVIIFGNEITVSEQAEKIGTIPYEILTSISPRVKRVYYQE
jgi:alanine racemase